MPSARPPRSLSLAAAAALLCAAPAAAQGLREAYVTDSSDDLLYHLVDTNADGDFDDAGEVIEFYNDTIGPVALTNNSSVVTDEDGVVYVSDSTEDIVLALLDGNADGDADDASESWIFFDGNPGGNASGVTMTSAQNIIYVDGRFWVASANSSTGVDAILWLEDLNDDGDANDAGEAFEYYVIPSTSVADSIPSDLKFGPDGRLYFTETGSSGVYAKGIYVVEDIDSSGTIDHATERFDFYVPPTLPGNPFFWCLEVGPDGSFYMADAGNDLIWKVRDDNSNGVIDVGTEDVQWWSTGSSYIWKLALDTNGDLYVCESDAPDRLLLMNDADMSGTIDPVTEVTTIYDEGVSPTNITNPRGIALAPQPPPGVATCFGDGSASLCPCGNDATAGSETGCANSTGVGAQLTGSGSAQVAQQGGDPLVLSVTQARPNKNCVWLQGAGAPPATAFRDGLLCVGDPTIRLPGFGCGAFPIGTLDAAGAIATDDATYGFDVLSAALCKGDDIAAGAPTTRWYQLWFRDGMGPCGTGSNLSNAYEVLWQ